MSTRLAAIAMLSIACSAHGLAPAASAQSDSWEFELVGGVGSAADPLRPGAATATVRLSLGVPAGDHALAGVLWFTHADEPGWADPRALILHHPGQMPGEISGATVGPSSAGQLGLGGFVLEPGRIDVWEATFTATDFAPREIGLRTETERYEVWPQHPMPGPVARPLPAEGQAAIFVVPAPATVALLGLASLAATRPR